MNGCKYIRERIDEAENPNLLPFEVTEHLAECHECGRFAAQRSALRALLSGSTRVNPPVNFDAMLNARLAEIKSRSAFWWLGSFGYARIATATAVLVVMIFAAQFSGLFSTKPAAPINEPGIAAVPATPTPAPRIHAPETPIPTPVTPVSHGSRASYTAPRPRRSETAASGSVPIGYFTAEDGGVVLVRGRNGDLDVPVPTVSVGAQPLLYVSAGQRTARNVGSSF
jgi:hypothetical protein